MRELFKKYWRPFALGLFLMASLSYYSSHLRHKDAPSTIERQLLTLTYPLQKSVMLVKEGTTAIRVNLFGAADAATEVLRSENAQLKEQLVEHTERTQENERLKQLLSFRAKREEPMVAARVIGVDATSWFRSITIDRGSATEIREGMAVVSAYGVVGRVVTTSPHSSRVLLLVDAASKLSTLIERTRARAICRGDGDSMSLDYLPLTDDVQVGDLLITSGLGGAFPKGLIVGAVTRVDKGGFDMFQTVKVEPAVDFEHLEEVLVILSTENSSPPSGGKP
ncbi:MAG: rod shape-determining protein MreC [Desulfuromonadales bacterium]|nr:rod shape-determining protein MreC [Desulfuromonadales bacterium]